MTVQIIGGGCAKCEALAKNAETAIKELNLEAVIEKVTDSNAILEMGVLMTPALAIDGNVKSSGRVLSAGELKDILEH